MGTWKALKDKHFSLEEQARIKDEARADIGLIEAALDELRQARSLSQTQLAEILEIKQSSVSKIERQTDMYLSTLRNFIRAMGGELDVIARFPDAPAVRIARFGEGGDEPRVASIAETAKRRRPKRGATKAAATRENGKKGGSPKKAAP